MLPARFSYLIVLLLSAFCMPAHADITFNLSGTGNAMADAGFQAAADYVSSQFDDDVTININTGFASLPSGVLGSAGSVRDTYFFSDFRNAITADITSSMDATFAASLPTGSSFSLWINETSQATGASNENPYLDNNGSANNNLVRLTHANAKALGLRSANDTANDVNITFSSNFTWDFDPTDGINFGAYDFVGVAIHEIMHGMGFTSGVDVLDGNDDGAFSENAFTWVNSLDFLRHSADSVAAGADLDWTADSRAKFYSYDGGMSAGIAGTNHWSTGRANGDGQQASHWKDELGIGIMDPTSQPRGSLNSVTQNDLDALDLIGWNFSPVPEPSSFMMMAVSLGVLSRRRKRKK